MKSLGTVVAACVVAISGSLVHAAEETLDFRLVSRNLVSSTHTDPKIEGLELYADQSIGVAVFEDGRLAYKEFVSFGLAGATPAPARGYSSYVF